MRKLGILGLICVSMVLLSCGGNRSIVQPETVPGLAQSEAVPGDYVLGTGDILKIEFSYSQNLNRQLTIRPDGKITLPLKGETMAAGITPAELNKKITSLYADTLKDPVITVSVEGFNKSNLVYVMGEVQRPDYYQMESPTTVTQILARAGVISSTANLNSILVISRGEEGKPVGKLVNVNEVLKKANLDYDVVLKKYDIVYVPKTSIAKANQFVDQYINRMVPNLFRFNYVLGNSHVTTD